MPILFGYIFAWIFYPLLKKMKKRVDEKLSITLLIIITVLIYSFIVWKLVPIILANIENLFGLFNTYIEKIDDIPFLEGFRDLPRVDAGTIIDKCSSILGFLLKFGLVHLFGFYILYNYGQINSYLRRLIPFKYRKISLEYLRKLSINMRAYIRGTLIDTLILFLASSVLYFIIGLDYPIDRKSVV